MLGSQWFELGWYPTKSNLHFTPHGVVRQKLRYLPHLSPRAPKTRPRVCPGTVTDRPVAHSQPGNGASASVPSLREGMPEDHGLWLMGPSVTLQVKPHLLRSNIKWNSYFLDGEKKNKSKTWSPFMSTAVVDQMTSGERQEWQSVLPGEATCWQIRHEGGWGGGVWWGLLQAINIGFLVMFICVRASSHAWQCLVCGK